MTEEPSYDLSILGAGPGGYVAAIRAAQLGMKVALVEREYLGGVCLNWGCIPTKALLRNAEIARLLGNGKEFGFSMEEVTLDYGAAADRSKKVATRLIKGIQTLLEKNGVEILWGSGRLTAPTTLEVTLNEGDSRTLTAKATILATGGRPCVPPGMTPDGDHILTARHAIERRTLPASAIIIGGGPIGLEIATIWARYGAAVQVVEMQPQILPAEDEEAASELERALRRQKIRVHTATRVTQITKSESGVRVAVTNAKGEQVLEAEVALVAVGFCAAPQGLGLEELGVRQEKSGWIAVDGYLRTNLPGLYAIGDCNGTLPLAHVASAQGIAVVETLAGIERPPFDCTFIPHGTYTTPQVASFGLTEAKARAQGLSVRVGKFPFLPNGKALGLGENQGFVKIVAEEESHKLLGAVIVGPEATELLPELVLAHEAGLSPEAVAQTVHAHPTLNEAIMEAAHGVFGKAIHMI